MHLRLTFPLILQTACVFFNVSFCLAQPQEAILIRDATERNELFEGRKKIVQTKNLDTIEEDEESLFLQMAERSTVFVDKSLFIKKILGVKQKVIVINAPRKSGKTINLNMLKDFLEIRVDDTGTVPPTPITSTHRFFTSGVLNTATDRPLEPLYDRHPRSNSIFPIGDSTEITAGDSVTATYVDSLLIAKHGKSIVEEHLGQYAIILLNLENEPLSRIEETINDALKNRVCYVFIKSTALSRFMGKRSPNSTTPSGEKKEMLERFLYYRRVCGEGSMTDDELENSMIFFSKMLHLWTGKQVVILIDNYDLIFKQYLFKVYLYDHKEKIKNQSLMKKEDLQLFRNFLKKTLSENPYLAKAVVAGTLSVSKKTLFADIPDILYHNAIDPIFEEFFAFTEGEVKLLFDHFEIPTDLDHQARLFYNGYIAAQGSNVTLYSIESIVKFVNSKVIQDYWIREVREVKFLQGKWDQSRGGVNYWINFELLGNVLQPLIDGNDTSIYFMEVDCDMEHVLLLNRYKKKQVTRINETTANVGFSMLLEMGFFTISERSNENITNIRIRIPNEEIRRGLREMIATSPMFFRQEQWLNKTTQYTPPVSLFVI